MIGGGRCPIVDTFWQTETGAIMISPLPGVTPCKPGTAEVESALVSHPAVAEAAVVGRPDEIKGQAVVAFVTLKEGQKASPEMTKQLKNHVGTAIGAIAKPDDIRYAAALPKTRSGKIMRRLLKEICSGGVIKGDTTTLEDLNVVAQLSAGSKDDD